MACATNIQSALLGILSQQIKKKQKEKFLVNDHCEKSKWVQLAETNEPYLSRIHFFQVKF